MGRSRTLRRKRKALVARKNNQFSTIRRQEELWSERNSGTEQIVILSVKRENSDKTCEVTWTTEPEFISGTDIHVFDIRSRAEEQVRNLEAILHKYETETEIGTWIRLSGRIAITIGVGLLILEFVDKSMREVIQQETIRALVAGGSAATAMWISSRVAKRVDKRVEILVGVGKRRAEFNKWCRRATVTVALTTVLAFIAGSLT